MPENENVKVLDKALTILETLACTPQPLGVKELARVCGISSTSTFRILKTLQGRGWVIQNPSEKYQLGRQLALLSEKTTPHSLLKETAYFIMARHTAAVSQAMNLVVRENEICYILQQSRTAKIVDYVPQVGTVLPVYASACGKILLSELSDPLRGQILDTLDWKPLTAHTITSRERFLRELDTVRQTGYALDAHESQEEGFCIAVPVRDPDEKIIAALSFSGFIGRKNVEEIQSYVSRLHLAAAEITKNLFGAL